MKIIIYNEYRRKNGVGVFYDKSQKFVGKS